MEHIGAHLKEGSARGRKERATERGELLKYFAERLNRTRAQGGLPPVSIGRLARLLMATEVRDLYYLKSICEDAESRGGMSAFSKKFWWEVNPKKHPDDKIVVKKIAANKPNRA